MKTLRQVLKPSPLGFILLALVLTGQVIFFSYSATTHSIGDNNLDKSEFGIAIGTPIRVIEAGGQRNWEINWLTLFVNLFASYTVSMLCAVGIKNVTGLPRAGSVYGRLCLVLLALAFVVSISISKFYWGYFFSPPGVLAELNEISTIRSVIPVRSNDKHQLVADTDNTLSEQLARPEPFEESEFEDRVLGALQQRKLFPTRLTLDLNNLPKLESLLAKSGLLAKSSAGYDSQARMFGIVIDALDSSGQRLVILALRGGQVSNDHYPYYELAFRGGNSSSELSFIRGQRYFYDAAGMEGFEWYVILLFLGPLFVVAGLIIFTIWRAVRNGLRGSHPLETAPQ